MTAEYQKQLSIFKEIEDLAYTRYADARLMMALMDKTENSSGYGFYLQRALDSKTVLNFVRVKQDLREER